MTTQELLNFIQESPLSEETKSAARVILGGHDTVTLELQGKIKDLIQAELDADFDEVGVTLSDGEIEAERQKFNNDIAQVDADLAEDVVFVQRETDVLDGLQKDVSRALDEIEADVIRQDLTKQA